MKKDQTESQAVVKTEESQAVVNSEESQDSQDLVIINPESLNPAEIIAELTLSKEQFAANYKVALKLTSYIGAASEKADAYIGQTVEVIGAIAHDCTVRNEDGVLMPEVRTVFKMKDGKNLGFVSRAAQSFCNNCLFPFFGRGDFAFPVKVKIMQITSGNNRTYNFQVVE